MRGLIRIRKGNELREFIEVLRKETFEIEQKEDREYHNFFFYSIYDANRIGDAFDRVLTNGCEIYVKEKEETIHTIFVVADHLIEMPNPVPEHLADHFYRNEPHISTKIFKHFYEQIQAWYNRLVIQIDALDFYMKLDFADAFERDYCFEILIDSYLTRKAEKINKNPRKYIKRWRNVHKTLTSLEMMPRDYGKIIYFVGLILNRLTDIAFEEDKKRFYLHLLQDKAYEGRQLPYELTKKIVDYL